MKFAAGLTVTGIVGLLLMEALKIIMEEKNSPINFIFIFVKEMKNLQQGFQMFFPKENQIITR